MGTYLVLAVLALVVGLAVRSIYKDRRSGSHCGGNCGNCSGSCHCRHD